jgi:prepilin-type N-terminal cleavage/methylation domain-containing protein
MTLNNIKTMKKDRGFTIVELLIVIVVIAILAAITIVAYNGVQKRANASATKSGANILQKKVEAYNAIQSSYPAGTTELNGVADSALTGSGISLVAAPDSSTGKTSFKYEKCGTTGGRITYYDFNAGSLPTAAQILMGDAPATGGTCTVGS